MLTPQIKAALEHGQTIDITTFGRRTGQPRRIEIWYHNLDGHIYITGLPGRRDWYANLLNNPMLTFHLKQGIQADLVARAMPIVDAAERRGILTRILPRIGRIDELEVWVERSPLIEVVFDTETEP